MGTTCSGIALHDFRMDATGKWDSYGTGDVDRTCRCLRILFQTIAIAPVVSNHRRVRTRFCIRLHLDFKHAPRSADNVFGTFDSGRHHARSNESTMESIDCKMAIVSIVAPTCGALGVARSIDSPPLVRTLLELCRYTLTYLYKNLHFCTRIGKK